MLCNARRNLSSDFRGHAVSRLLAGIFEQHDRTQFEIIGISLSPSDHSDLGRRVCAAFERWKEASRLTDADIAALIRRLEVDILVDLNGWTRGMRPECWRAAPHRSRASSDSVLWLVADGDSARRNLLDEAERRGVGPDRLLFAPRLTRQICRRR